MVLGVPAKLASLVLLASLTGAIAFALGLVATMLPVTALLLTTRGAFSHELCLLTNGLACS